MKTILPSACLVLMGALVCLPAGAAPVRDFQGELRLSAYQPKQHRAPFTKPGAGARNASAAEPKIPGKPISLQLEGVLLEAGNPSAIVNGRLLTLNKSVQWGGAEGEIQIKAVEITRARVVLEVDGQRVELQLAAATRSTP